MRTGESVSECFFLFSGEIDFRRGISYLSAYDWNRLFINLFASRPLAEVSRWDVFGSARTERWEYSARRGWSGNAFFKFVFQNFSRRPLSLTSSSYFSFHVFWCSLRGFISSELSQPRPCSTIEFGVSRTGLRRWPARRWSIHNILVRRVYPTGVACFVQALR